MDEWYVGEDRGTYQVELRRLEDVVAWRLARVLAVSVYRISSKPAISRDFSFADQLRRAAVSVMNNVAEGYERMSTDGDLAHFLSIAKGSAGEVRSMLFLALDIGYIDEVEFAQVKAQADEAIRVIVGYRKWALARSSKGR